MSEIDSIISDIRSESGSSIRSFDKLFNDTQDDVDDILNNNNLLDNDDEIGSIPSSHTNSQRSSTHSYRSANSHRSSKSSQSQHQSKMTPPRTYRSANSHRSSNSSIPTKFSALTHENLMKKQEEMETEKTKPRYSKSIHGSVKSFKSDTDYSSLYTYKNSQKRKVKTQRPLDLTGSPNEVIERIDNMVKCICEEHNINIRSPLAEKHRDTILIQVFLNTMNSDRKDIARACKESMSKSSQKKTPCIESH